MLPFFEDGSMVTYTSREVKQLGSWHFQKKTRNMAGILAHNPSTDSEFKHAYLAAQQGTKYAVMAVYSVEEKMHFTKMMQTFPGFSLPNLALNFKDGTQTWNSEANGQTIFYKVCSIDQYLFPF
jgi:hypothetical protein